MQYSWRSKLAILAIAAAIVSPAFAGPNEHASDQGTQQASDKSKGDQAAPSQQAVKEKHPNEAGQPAAAGKGTAQNHKEGKGKQGKGKEKEHAE